jgi:hypothetical protein
MPRPANGNGKTHAAQQSVDAAMGAMDMMSAMRPMGHEGCGARSIMMTATLAAHATGLNRASERIPGWWGDFTPRSEPEPAVGPLPHKSRRLIPTASGRIIRIPANDLRRAAR